MDRPATYWMMEPLRKYASFTGRASRSEYWWFYLLCIVISIATSVFDRSVILTIAGGIISLALLVPQIAVGVRRLHDVNRSGWWFGVPLIMAIPVGVAVGFFGLAALRTNPGGGLLLVFGIVALAVLGYSILMLVWFCTRGTAGPNRYGPDPHDPAGDVAAVFS